MLRDSHLHICYSNMYVLTLKTNPPVKMDKAGLSYPRA